MTPPPRRDFRLAIFHKHYRFFIALRNASGRSEARPVLARRPAGKHGTRNPDFTAPCQRPRGLERLTQLREASLSLDLLKILVRLAKDVKALPDKTYLAWKHD